MAGGQNQKEKNMRKLLICGLCVAALAACDKKEQPIGEAAIKCGDLNVAIKTYSDRIDATINEQTISMSQVVSASGAKYQSDDKQLILWNKGESWTMLAGKEEEAIILDCQ
jgi:membrane-bound inhibitor of C-type lysozyme